MRLGESRFPAARGRGLASGRDARCVMVADLLTSERGITAKRLNVSLSEYDALRTIAEQVVPACAPTAARLAQAEASVRAMQRAFERQGGVGVDRGFDAILERLGQRIAGDGDIGL